MGMGIEPFSIHEWEWELIPIFSQWMGMGINSPKMMNGPKSAAKIRDQLTQPRSLHKNCVQCDLIIFLVFEIF